MPKRVSIGSNRIGRSLSSGISGVQPSSPSVVLPKTPNSLDSRHRHRRRSSPPSTLTTAPTTRSRSKKYYLRPRSKVPVIERKTRKRPTRRKLMGKGSDWTANQELVLLNILKDKVVDGTVQDCSPHSALWPEIVAQFNETTALTKTTAQVQEKLRRMKRQWRRFYQLLHHETGFGWDPENNKVTGTAAQWTSYLAMHKNASSFRKKGLPNYELMCELFSASTATGKNHHASTISPPDTDDERDHEDDFIGLGVDDSNHPSNTGDASTAQPPSTPCTSSGKRGIDSISSVQHRMKRAKGKGKSVASEANSMALLKFVSAQDRRNDILEQWMTMKKSMSLGMTGPAQDDASGPNDLYTKCLRILQTVLPESEHKVFLKGCKELENVFTQKAFSIMTDEQRKSWLYSL